MKILKAFGLTFSLLMTSLAFAGEQNASSSWAVIVGEGEGATCLYKEVSFTVKADAFPIVQAYTKDQNAEAWQTSSFTIEDLGKKQYEYLIRVTPKERQAQYNRISGQNTCVPNVMVKVVGTF